MDNIITNVDGVKVKVRVYDFGDEVADRYTIVYVNKNIKDGYGVVYYPVFSCSEDPFHPLGVWGCMREIIIRIEVICTILVKE